MDGVTFAWTLLSTLLAGCQMFAQRVSAKEGRNSALNGVIMYGFSGLAALTLLLLFYGIPDELYWIVIFGLAAGVTHAIGNFIRMESLKYIDSVIFFPLNKMLGPILVIAGGMWWFGETLSLREIIGIVLSICVPLLLVSSAEHHRQINLRRGLIFLLIATVFMSVGVLLTKEGIRYDDTLLCIMVLGQASAAVTSLIIFLREKHVRADKNFGITRADIKLGLITAVFCFTGFLALLKAMSVGDIGIVYTINAHYILIPIVLSIWWYGDHIDARKIVAVTLSFLAIGLLV